MIRDTYSLASNTTKKSINKRHGFTIIELVVVIAVIAILAAITVVGYGAWRKQTLTNQVKSDLTAVAGAMESARTFDNKYPANIPSTVNSSDSASFVGGANANGSSYCVTKMSSEDPSIVYYIASWNKSAGPQVGECVGPVNGGVVTAFAGGLYDSGYVDATGTAAKFDFPFGIAVNSAGVMYVADRQNSVIRKITPNGSVTTFAGSTSGFADGPDSAAQFSSPQAVAVDVSGNIYVADSGNFRIRKITPGGVVTTLAGSTSGSANGTGSAAQFSTMNGIAVDAAGNVYVSDSGNHRIRMITPGGVVTTLAGSTSGYVDATGTSARFNNPYGIAVDATGTVFVVDGGNSRIRKITAGGVVTTFAGSTSGFADGTGSAAQFNTPRGLTIDAYGTLYLADTVNYRIRKITPSAVVTTVAGSTFGNNDGTGAAAGFDGPQAITVDQSGVIYVVESVAHRIRKIQ